MATSILSPSPHLLTNTAFLFGLIPTALGINAILRPRSALTILQFARPKDAEAGKLVDNLMRIYGSRDIVVGLPVLIAWYLGDRQMLGWMMVIQAVIPFVDAWATRLQNGRGEWNHLPVGFVGLGLGGGILGWFGGQ